MTDKRKMLVEGYQARPKAAEKTFRTDGYQATSGEGKPPKGSQLPKGATSGVTIPKSTATK